MDAPGQKWIDRFILDSGSSIHGRADDLALLHRVALERKVLSEILRQHRVRKPTLRWFGQLGKQDSSRQNDLNFEQILLLDANRLFLRVSIGWCLICAIPLIFMIRECTGLLRHLGF